MFPRRSSAAAAWLASVTIVCGAAFDPEAGLPVIRNFPPESYRGHNQVFASVRAADGVMYFGTYGAVVSFDGERWRQHPVPGTWIRALAAGADGRIYVGGGGLLGRLEPAAGGDGPRFVSLADRLPAAQRDFATTWSAAAAGDAVLFSIDGAALAWRDGTFRAWPFPGLRPAIRPAGADVYCHAGDQLLRWDGRDWRPFARDARLASARRLTLLPADAGALLVALDHGALLRAESDGRLAPWPTPAADFIRRAGVRNGLRLDDGSYVLSTATEGLVFLAADGTPVRRLHGASGLAHSATYGLAQGAAGQLWVETANGLSVFDPRAPWSTFDLRNGRPDTIGGDIRRFAGEIWVTMADVTPLRLTPARDAFDAARFETLPVPGASRITNLALVHGALLSGSDRGVVRVSGTPKLLHPTDSQVEDLLPLRSVPDVIVAGLTRGAELVRLTPDLAARTIARVPDFDFEVTNIAEAAAREVWIGTTSGLAVRLRLQEDGTLAEATRFGADRGLPAGSGWVKLHATGAGPVICVRDGVFRPTADGTRLEPDPRFATHRPAGINTLPIESDGDRRFWFQIRRADGEFEAGCLDLRGEQPVWLPLPAEVNPPLGFGGVRDVSLLREGDREVLWLAGTRATIRLDLSVPVPVRPPPDVVITTLRQGSQAFPPGPAPLRLPFSREPIRLQFASPDAVMRPVRYETRLSGYDARWTAATTPEATFTNLTGGPFTFEVRALDALGRTGAAARVLFRVAPPWHRSPVAYVTYALGLAGAVLGLIRWRVSRTERERRRLAELVATRTAELATARDQAEAASRAKSAFLAAMSHELRTPLNGVIGYAQILQSDPRLAPDQQERLQIVQHSGEHLLRMINDVLDLAKIEAGRIEVCAEDFSLANLLRDLAASHAPAAARKGLAFAVEAQPDLPAHVRGDPLKLRQVLDNLLGNALKFTAEGSVTLRAGRDGGRVAFAVADTGPGIPVHEQARLFQPFEQAGTRGDTPGTGLGLAISRVLVERMGGALSLDSAPGHGSTFAFTLPLPAVGAPETVAAPATRITGHDGPSRRVLVVDDHAVNRGVVVELLAPLGFTCEAVASGDAALARLEDTTQPWPDLLILDVRMAGLDGLALTRRIRALPRGREVRILLMSASVLSFDPQAGREAGADGFLAKPFRAQDLLAAVGRLLGVRWREEAVPAAPALAAAPATAPLPAEIAARLREALVHGDLEEFRRALGAGQAAWPAFAERWRELDAAAAGFQLSRLRQLLESP
ncbi:MAG: response regulator [Opitutaceae bacterium]|nr:response regulator [Opitutaceae bacterium]